MALLSAVMLLCAGVAWGRCPRECACALKSGRKEVVCSGGGLLAIPTQDMDPNTHVIEVTAPPAGPHNNLTLGRIFLKFPSLECVRVEGGGVPAIGDSSFWPGRRLRRLLLPNNRISFLRESDFNGLRNLLELDLTGNEIAAAPSAPFRHLVALRTLLLARNRLHTLAPRFFYLLHQLEELDLSGNPLGQIGPEDLQDVRQLRVLRVAACRLKRLHPLVYQQLPLLAELDLRDNQVAQLGPAEFRHLAHLRVLRMDGNLLTTLPEGAFHSHHFELLGLSRNQLSSMSDTAFVNASVRHLDLSHNRLEYALPDTTRPLAATLEVLNVSFNDLGAQAFAALVRPLLRLRHLQATDLLLKELEVGLLLDHSLLDTLNLSRNGLSGLEPASSLPASLRLLDLSFNLFAHFSSSALDALLNSTRLRVRIRGNPFDCSSGCLVAPLALVLNESLFVQEDDCPRCQLPLDLQGSCLAALDDLYCGAGAYERHYLAHTSRLGMIVAVAIIVVIVCIIVVIVIVYRRHIAHYYTHEEEQRAWKSMYENPGALVAPSADGKSTFVATPDRVDDVIDDLRPATIMR